MAEVLSDFPYNASHKIQFPWDDWLDGRVWKLKHGEDYHCSTMTMQTKCRVMATSRGLKVRIRWFRDPERDADSLVIQAYKEGCH